MRDHSQNWGLRSCQILKCCIQLARQIEFLAGKEDSVNKVVLQLLCEPDGTKLEVKSDEFWG